MADEASQDHIMEVEASPNEEQGVNQAPPDAASPPAAPDVPQSLIDHSQAFLTQLQSIVAHICDSTGVRGFFLAKGALPTDAADENISSALVRSLFRGIPVAPFAVFATNERIMLFGSAKKVAYFQLIAEQYPSANSVPIVYNKLEVKEAKLAENASAIEALVTAITEAKRIGVIDLDARGHRTTDALCVAVEGALENPDVEKVDLKDVLPAAMLACFDERAAAACRVAGTSAGAALESIVWPILHDSLTEAKTPRHKDLVAKLGTALSPSKLKLSSTAPLVEAVSKLDVDLPNAVAEGLLSFAPPASLSSGYGHVELNSDSTVVPNSHHLSPDCIFVSVGARYAASSARVTRTYFVGANTYMRSVYQGIQAAFLAAARAAAEPYATLGSIARAAAASAEGDADLAGRLVLNCGGPAGALSLSHPSTDVVVDNALSVPRGACLYLSICARGIPVKERAKKTSAPAKDAAVIDVDAEGNGVKEADVKEDKEKKENKDAKKEGDEEDDDWVVDPKGRTFCVVYGDTIFVPFGEGPADVKDLSRVLVGDAEVVTAAARSEWAHVTVRLEEAPDSDDERRKRREARFQALPTFDKTRLRSKGETKINPMQMRKMLQRDLFAKKYLMTKTEGWTYSVKDSKAKADVSAIAQLCRGKLWSYQGGELDTFVRTRRVTPGMLTIDGHEDAKPSRPPTLLCPVLKVPGSYLHLPISLCTIAKTTAVTDAGDEAMFRINLKPFDNKSAAQAPFSDCLFIKEITYRSPGNKQYAKLTSKVTEAIKKGREIDKASNLRVSIKKQAALVQSKVPKARLNNIVMRPAAGTSKKRNQGRVELHENGFRYISPSDPPVDILYNNVRHALLVPVQRGETACIMHFKLHEPLMLKKTLKSAEIQFFTEIDDDMDRGDAYRTEEASMRAEAAAEAEKQRRNKDFQAFAQRMQVFLRQQTPQVSFEVAKGPRLLCAGSDHRDTGELSLFTKCLGFVHEAPFSIYSLDDIEIIFFQNMGRGILAVCQVAVIWKDYSKKPGSLDNVEMSKDLGVFQDWLCKHEVPYIEAKEQIAWDKVLEAVRSQVDDGDWNPWNKRGWPMLDQEHCGLKDVTTGDTTEESGDDQDESDSDTNPEDSDFSDSSVSSSESEEYFSESSGSSASDESSEASGMEWSDYGGDSASDASSRPRRRAAGRTAALPAAARGGPSAGQKRMTASGRVEGASSRHSRDPRAGPKVASRASRTAARPSSSGAVRTEGRARTSAAAPTGAVKRSSGNVPPQKRRRP